MLFHTQVYLTGFAVCAFHYCVGLEAPNITDSRHTSISSIILEWTHHGLHSLDEGNKHTLHYLDGVVKENSSNIIGFNVTITPLEGAHRTTKVNSSLCNSRGPMHFLKRSAKWWVFRNLKATKSYVACVKALNDTTQSTWNLRLVQPEGKRPPGLVHTAPFHIVVDKLKRPLYLHPIFLDCSADGIPKPRITWYADGTIIRPDGYYHEIRDNGTLVTKKENGKYHCVAKNEFGVAISSHTYLISQSKPPNIDIIEVEFTVRLHDNASLPCKVPQQDPPFDVKWVKLQYKKDPHPVQVAYDDRILLHPKGHLLFANVEKKDHGLYECCLHGAGTTEGRQYSNLKVGDPVTKDWPPKLMSKSSTDLVAIVSRPFDLYCIFGGWPTPTVTWHKVNRSLSQTGAFYNKTYVTIDDAGLYKCTGRNTAGHASEYITVVVEAAPSWKEKPQSINATQGSHVVINCSADGNPQPDLIWTINGMPWDASQKKVQVHGGSLEIANASRDRDLMVVQCNVSNKYGELVSSAYINVMLPTKIIESPLAAWLLYPHNVVFSCEAETDPGSELRIDWLHNNRPVDYQGGMIYKRKNDNALVLETAKDRHKGVVFLGNYTCVASNDFSRAEQTAQLAIRPTTEPSTAPNTDRDKEKNKIVLYCSIGGIFLAVVVCVAVIVTLQMRSKRRKKKANINTPMQFSSLIRRETNPLENIHDESLRIMIEEVTVPRDKLRLGRLLGRGQFGQVVSGLLQKPKGSDDETQVAVKTLKYNSGDYDTLEKFLWEAMVMRDFNNPYVLSLVGITFEPDGTPMVILPFMENGDLQTYIRDPDREITVLELLRMGLQVARGMEYLAGMRFVHRDLAARNCMVDACLNVKVADFGLSRDIYSRDYYRLEDTQACIPVRWMAPESLEFSCFSTVTDVWAYGVLMWELMTRGGLPYPDVDNWEIRAYLQSGRRLERPHFCPDSIYSIMMACWHIDPEQRPSFTDIIQQIEQILSRQKVDNRRAIPGAYMNIDRNANPADYRPVEMNDRF